MSSTRIVLVDPLGDVLFSGDSWVATSAPASCAGNHEDSDADADGEECPRTLRSESEESGSGIFQVEPARDATEATEGEPIQETKRDERAA